MVWLNHHRLFTHIKRINTVLVLLNLLLLMFIVFVPVPTALLAEYVELPDQHAAAIVYSGTFFLTTIIASFALALFFALPPRLPGSKSDANGLLTTDE